VKPGNFQLALALSGLVVTGVNAESTNETGSVTNPAPARTEFAPVKLDEAAFRIISERNIFNANRSGGTVRSASTRRPTRVETFALTGTMAYEKGAFAFFEGSSSEFTKVLKTDGLIAGHKLVDILAHAVKLEMDGEVLELAIGSGMRREDQGAWKVTEVATAPEATAGGSGEASGRNSRNGRSRRGEDTNADSTGSRGAETTSSAASSAAPSSAEQSDILKKLMERREKESQ
jgi:hypothetical protein